MLYLDSLPQIRRSCTIFLDTTYKREKIAVITCSNGEHNLEFADIRKSLDDYAVDFYIFNGNTNFNYIKYLKDKNILQTDQYSKIILYLPYVVYSQSPTFPHRWGWFQIYASKDYLKFIISKSPYILLTEPWLRDYFEMIGHKDELTTRLADSIFTVSYSSRTRYIDSLIVNKTSYFTGTLPFLNYEFNNNTDPNEVYKLKTLIHKKTLIFLPPMTNTAQNLKYMFTIKSNPYFEILNSYSNSIKDSTLFYDQWWHLNFKGRGIETKEFIESIKMYDSKKIK